MFCPGVRPCMGSATAIGLIGRRRLLRSRLAPVRRLHLADVTLPDFKLLQTSRVGRRGRMRHAETIVMTAGRAAGGWVDQPRARWPARPVRPAQAATALSQWPLDA